MLFAAWYSGYLHGKTRTAAELGESAKAMPLAFQPIELISVFVVRPFSLAVRLFANLLAGHILVVTFAVLTAALFAAEWYAIILPLPFFMLIFVFAFELLVSVLQAYIFTILTAVYIGGAVHPEH